MLVVCRIGLSLFPRWRIIPLLSPLSWPYLPLPLFLDRAGNPTIPLLAMNLFPPPYPFRIFPRVVFNRKRSRVTLKLRSPLEHGVLIEVETPFLLQ